MSLTRSYVQSYLLLNSGNNYISSNKDDISRGGEGILNHGYIEGVIPSENEIEELHEELHALKSKPTITLADVLLKSFNKYGTDYSKRETLANMIGEHQSIKNNSWDEKLIDELVKTLSPIC